MRVGCHVSGLGSQSLPRRHADRLSENVGVLGEGVTQLGQGVSEIGQGVSQLGQEVTTIAESSEAIQQEIEAARPQTMSEIFTNFQKNRATIKFTQRLTGIYFGYRLFTPDELIF